MEKQGFVIRLARESDLPTINTIEWQAGQRFFDAGFPWLPRQEFCLPEEELRQGLKNQQLWVATAEGEGMGFILAGNVDEQAHIKEIDVLPQFGRRGVGSALIQYVINRAKEQGIEKVTLTTFEDIPWNAPFYKKLGFKILEESEITPELKQIYEQELADNAVDWNRCAMSLEIHSGSSIR